MERLTMKVALVLLTLMTGIWQETAGRDWQAKWIAYPYERVMGNCACPVMPMPVFRQSFSLQEPLDDARLFVSGLGFFSCLVDGRPVSDARLVPAPTQYDRRWRYRRFCLGRLEAGKHELSIAVGDGFYRAATAVYWHFERAPWTDYPKAIAELTDGATGKVVLQTDESWKVAFGPVRKSALRGGETYDAREELPALGTEGGRWKHARIVPGPGGVDEEETFPPCRIVEAHPMRYEKEVDMWMAPVNLSGVPRIHVRGTAGAEIELLCCETQYWPREDGSVFTNRLVFGTPWRVGGVQQDDAQVDRYVLSGKGVEVWSPEFTYHGFQNVKVRIRGKAEILKMEALSTVTDFSSHGSFQTSDEKLMRIGEAALRSCRNNFVGIPTDCPQREKNGWTSEARLMCEPLLYSTDCAGAYAGFVKDIVDAQRPNGQLPGMLPTGGVGYNWGSGPAWDAALLMIPESIYDFTGDLSLIREHYANMRRYVDYCETLLDREGLMTFGLGDWLPPREATAKAPVPFVTTAFYIKCLAALERFAGLIGLPDDQMELSRKRQRTVKRLQAKFYRGKGRFDANCSTVMALALQFDLVPIADRGACAEKLAHIVCENNAKVDYGTVGSGCVLRQLFENGFADLAYEVMTQPEYPGYWNWFDQWQLTTFPENWKVCGSGSNNHGAFADIVAVFYRYLAGFRPKADATGRCLVVMPCFPKRLNDFEAEFEGCHVSWRREGSFIGFKLVICPGRRVVLNLPKSAAESLECGVHERRIRMEL